MTKRIPKEGDYIKHSNWDSGFYRVHEVGEDTLLLDMGRMEPFSLVSKFWEFRDPEKPVLDLSKPVQTKSGTPVRILCTDGPGALPVIGVTNTLLMRWTLEGEYPGYPSQTLSNIPEKPKSVTETFVLVTSRQGKTSLIRQKEYGEQGWVNAKKERRILAVKEITITEGEGMK